MAQVSDANAPNLSHSSLAPFFRAFLIVFLVLVTAVTLLRMYAKLSIIKSWVWEDCASPAKWRELGSIASFADPFRSQHCNMGSLTQKFELAALRLIRRDYG